MKLPDAISAIPGITVEAWNDLTPSAQAIILAIVGHYEQRITEYEQRCAAYEEQRVGYEKRIAELEDRLKRNPSNSSMPPSSDIFKKHRKKHKPSGKPPGRSPGHLGEMRALVPLEEVDAVHDHSPVRCEHCGDPLVGDDAVGPLERHQVSELPPITPTITEHQACDRRCKKCGKISKGAVPTTARRSAFGPRAHAIASILSGRCRVSRRDVAECFEQIFGLPICPASVQHMLESVGDALGSAYDEALAAARAAQVRYIDETSWPVAGKRGWLWVCVTAQATVFTIASGRGQIVLIEWIGLAALAFGYVVSDRYGAYNLIEMVRRGICHAHLKRDFTKIGDLGGPTCTLGPALSSVHYEIFALWHRFRDQEIHCSDFKAQLAPLRRAMRNLLEQGKQHPHRKIAGICTDILRHWEAMWNFAVIEGMEPTNNAAERALRPAVIWRKVSSGTRSNAGSRFVERMLTVVATCKQNLVNFCDYITRVVEAEFQGHSPPKLLPTPPPAIAA